MISNDFLLAVGLTFSVTAAVNAPRFYNVLRLDAVLLQFRRHNPRKIGGEYGRGC